jgi:hypothetical protein
VTGVKFKDLEGKPSVELEGSHSIQPQALLLGRVFGAAAAWDIPQDGVIGPQDLNLEYAGFSETGTVTYKVSIFRPIKDVAKERVFPICISNTPYWGLVYPVCAIRYGRGFLIPIGMSLNDEREFILLMEILKDIVQLGFKTLIG